MFTELEQQIKKTRYPWPRRLRQDKTAFCPEENPQEAVSFGAWRGLQPFGFR